MKDNTPGAVFEEILQIDKPVAIAWIKGNSENPQLSGAVRFYNTPYEGILIEAEIFGLPNRRQAGSTNFYAMHIHEEGNCEPPFNRTGEHYSKFPAPHPDHSGDLIPLFGNQGYAWLAFYNKRITIEQIVGRSVIIHAGMDDFTSQPSGNAGSKIGCGVVKM